VQWWCSAQGLAWSWTWRPYLGVWLLVALLVAGYVHLARRAGGVPAARGGAFAAGVACLWIALDWPVGALAAGYLASVHMVQFLLVALIAPPLLLYSVPEGAWERLAGRRAIVGVLEWLTRPLIALLAFNALVWLTHWPSLVDGLMGWQVGSFLIDMLWILAGTLFWWPVAARLPSRPGFGYPAKVAYLILATITNTGVFIYLTFSHLPVYATYELAPPIPWISAREDQQVAGLLMKLGGGLVLWTAIALLFGRWYLAEEA
jgi:cytochrome c oxidase assembly factor CtaG